MLAPLRTVQYFTKKTVDITRNEVAVNINSIIESFCSHISAETFVIHRELVNTIRDWEAERDEIAEAQDIVIPDDDSDSDDSSTGSSDEAIAEQETPASTSALVGSKRESFIRRRRRKLKFYLLPRVNAVGVNVPPPYQTIKEKKVCLRSYFRKFKIPVDLYKEWFIPL